MKIRSILFIALGLFMSLSVFAQDCKLYFPENIGTVREMTNYDKKDKVTGRVVQTILDKDVNGQNISLSVETVIYDDKDNEFSRSSIEVGCENGVFKIDMSDYLSEMLEAYQTMEVELQGDNLQFPGKISVGDELPDGNMNIQVSNSGITMVNMDVIIKNRKVLAKEKVTTDAGTFDCYKISYETDAKTRMMTVTTQGVEWIAEGVGVIRSESYNKRGKMTGYSLLTRLED